MKYVIDVTTDVATITFKDGKPPIEVRLTEFEPAVSTFLYRYGVKQFLQDKAAAALKLSKANGLDIEAQRRAMVQEKLDMLLNGNTAGERKSGAGRIGYLIRAVGILYKLSVAEATTSVAKMTDEKRKSFTASPKVAAMIAILKTEEAVARADRLNALANDDDGLPAIA